MWLPTSIYERIPQFYFLAGLLLITDGLYLGFEYSITFVYLGLGLSSTVYGSVLYGMRRMYRRAQSTADKASNPTDDPVPDSPATGGESVA